MRNSPGVSVDLIRSIYWFFLKDVEVIRRSRLETSDLHE